MLFYGVRALSVDKDRGIAMCVVGSIGTRSFLLCACVLVSGLLQVYLLDCCFFGLGSVSAGQLRFVSVVRCVDEVEGLQVEQRAVVRRLASL